ncbi:MAG: transglycosylase SLT domain-containing protein [candidate division Zixibacteria bacterium]
MKVFNPNVAPPPKIALDQLAAADKMGDKALQLEKLKKACKDFESIFISYMLKTMHKTTEDSGLFGKGLGGDIYQEIFDEKLAETMAESNQLKIGEIMFDRYSALVDGSKPETKSLKTDLKTELLNIRAKPDATSTIMQMSRPPESTGPKLVAADDKPLKDFDSIITRAAEKFGLKPGLIRAVIEHESAGNPSAVSPKGAKGLMQLMDSTAAMLGVANPFDPVANIMGGAKYLSMLLKKFGGDMAKTIASYNAGPGTVEKYNGVPPYPETQNYVRKVMSSMMSE